MTAPAPASPGELARLRLITWNVARRRTGLVEQAAALAGRTPDIVALQEVTRQTLPLWRHAFPLMGLPNVSSSVDRVPAPRRYSARRSLAIVIASRTPLSVSPRALAVPWPESALCTRVETEAGAVEVACVHVPNAANGEVKPETLRAVRAGLAVDPPPRGVLCGDLNTPRRELPTGEVISFARDSRGRLRPDRGPEWDDAELGVVPGLREVGYRDVYRTLHGYGRPDPSWTWRQIAGHDGGWRLDHVFATAALEALACAYHHAWRDDGLSDHSALEADFAVRAQVSDAGRESAPSS